MIKELNKFSFIHSVERKGNDVEFYIGGESYQIIKSSEAVKPYSLHQTKYYNGKTQIVPNPIKEFKSEDEILSFFDGMQFGMKFDFSN